MKRTMEQNRGNENASAVSEHSYEVSIRKTRFVVTSECSPSATETLEQKLLKIMGRHVGKIGSSHWQKPLENQVSPTF